jgi:hypothetical protein
MSDFSLKIPLNAQTINAVILNYGGKLHGDDGRNNWDVEFPTLIAACSFAQTLEGGTLGWDATLRFGQCIDNFYDSCTVTLSETLF